jgi:membrane-bound lytic murein transglycosylase B
VAPVRRALASGLVALGATGLIGAPAVSAEGPTTTTVPAPTSTTVPSTTTTAPALPPDDLTPIVEPPAQLPPVEISPVGAGGTNGTVDPADLAALLAAGNDAPTPGGVPGGLMDDLVRSRGADMGLSAAISAVDVASTRLTAAAATLATATAARDAAQAELDRIAGDQRAVARRAAAARSKLQRLVAVAVTTSGDQLSAVISADSPAQARAKLTSLETITDAASDAAHEWADRKADVDGRTEAAARRVADTDSVVEHARRLRDLAQAAVDSSTVRLSDAQVAAGVGPRSVPDIPNRMLVAYVRAAQWSSVVDPACHMTWWALAAIGRVESGHAGRSAIGIDGQTLPRIVGIPLDGTRGTARITDSDGGRFDGDPVYDRAVGPMQFIPGTWRGAGVDASGDGVADPNNVYDAAFAAARYLCAGAGGLRVDTEAGFRRAAFSYNHSAAYVTKVWDGSAPYRAIAATPLPAGTR